MDNIIFEIVLIFAGAAILATLFLYLKQPIILAYIALGSNLDAPKEQLARALDALRQLPRSRFISASGLYRTAPMGPPGQPDYINAVAAVETELEPLALLDALQAIEAAHGRVRLERWGPRTLDLDLLLYGEMTIDLPRLQVPHPGLGERNFVLLPLYQIAPELVLPDGRRLSDLVAVCSREGIEQVEEG